MLRKVHRLVEQLQLGLVDPASSILVRLEERLVVVPKADIQARLADATLTGLNIPEFRTTFVSQKWTRLKA
jgi:hypothetical protein